MDADETAVVIDVPHYSQEGPTAKLYFNDCGPACVRMVWGWQQVRLGRADSPAVTIDAMARRVLRSAKAFSSILELQRLGGMYGLNLRPVSRDAGITPDRIRSEIGMGLPLIALVLYGELSGRQNKGFTGGHFVVVVGYDADGYYLNDPDWYGKRASEGKGWRVPAAEFEQALNPGANRWFSNPYQGCLVRG